MWYKNGQLEYQYNFKDHLVYRWYENGQLKGFGDEEWYESGKIKKDGPKEWYENGNLLKDGCLEFDIDGKLLKDDCFEYDSHGNYSKQLCLETENSFFIGEKEWFQCGNIKLCVLAPFNIEWNEDGSLNQLQFKNNSEQVQDGLSIRSSGSIVKYWISTLKPKHNLYS